MADPFEDFVYREVEGTPSKNSKNIIKADKAKISGSAKVDVEEDLQEGVKIILIKDKELNIKEIKFVCSCGQTKSVVLDYNEE
jgi:hypothetical protein